MSRWFRHYAGMMRDDKLVRVAIRSKQTIERVVWIWGAVLESAAEIDDNGRFDVDAAEIAYFLRADEDDVGAVLSALAASGHVDADHVVKWGDRQFQSDKSNARVASYRERKRAEKRRSNGVEGECNADVTLHGRDGNAPETETETEVSVANATGAAAPPEPPLDPVKVMFDAGIRLFGLEGKPERSARSLLGKWRGQYGPEAVIAALGAAQREGAIDLTAFMERCLRNGRSGQNGSGNIDRRSAIARVLDRDIAEHYEQAERRGTGADGGGGQDSPPLLASM